MPEEAGAPSEGIQTSRKETGMKKRTQFIFMILAMGAWLVGPKADAGKCAATLGEKASLADSLSLRQKAELIMTNGIRNSALELNEERRITVLKETLADVQKLQRLNPRHHKKTARHFATQIRTLEREIKAIRLRMASR